jgi:hypothetical protein
MSNNLNGKYYSSLMQMETDKEPSDVTPLHFPTSIRNIDDSRMENRVSFRLGGGERTNQSPLIDDSMISKHLDDSFIGLVQER